MKIKQITECLENYAPLYLQEAYDNSGLLIGNHDAEVHKALTCIDVTEEIIDEAIDKKCDMIISHHPLIFNNLKRINGNSMTGRVITKAIKNNICIYAIHTNLDNVINGVNSIISGKLGLVNTTPLLKKENMLRKLVTFCPLDKAEQVKTALFNAGAGNIGNYDCCSFSAQGKGSFRAGENTNPYVGAIGKLHHEDEIRIETIYPVYKEKQVLDALFASHPYEEVAYDIYSLKNKSGNAGTGIIGELKKEETCTKILSRIKEITGAKTIRHSKLLKNKIRKVAICGGSGSALISEAIYEGADILITSDVKYHDFFSAEGRIIIADTGHYESEQFTKELIYSVLNKKFPKFAVLITNINTNPINYF